MTVASFHQHLSIDRMDSTTSPAKEKRSVLERKKAKEVAFKPNSIVLIYEDDTKKTCRGAGVVKESENVDEDGERTYEVEFRWPAKGTARKEEKQEKKDFVVIAITGTCGAGKGTVVEYLKKPPHNFLHYSARSLLYEIIDERKLSRDRDTLREVANELREREGPDAIAVRLFQKAAKVGKNAIIESIRTEGEIKKLREIEVPVVLLAVDADQKTRYERVVGRGSNTDNITFEEFREQERKEMESTDPTKQNLKRCMELADKTLNNDGDMVSFEKQIEVVLKDVLPRNDANESTDAAAKETKSEAEAEKNLTVSHKRLSVVRYPTGRYRMPQKEIPFRCTMYLMGTEKGKGNNLYKAKGMNLSATKRLTKCLQLWTAAWLYAQTHMKKAQSKSTWSPNDALSIHEKVELMGECGHVLMNMVQGFIELGMNSKARLHIDYVASILKTLNDLGHEDRVMTAKCYLRKVYVLAKLENWKGVKAAYKSGTEVAQTIEDEKTRRKWVKQIKKKFMWAVQEQKDAKAQRAKSFQGSLLSPSRSPNGDHSSPRAEKESTTSRKDEKTVVPASSVSSRTSTQTSGASSSRTSASNISQDEQEEGISTAVKLFGLFGVAVMTTALALWLSKPKAPRTRHPGRR